MADKEPGSNIENALWGSDENFHGMFKKHHAVVLVIEPESGQIMDANGAAEKFYGYSIERLRQMNITEINTLPSDEVAQERQRALHEKRSYFVFPHRLVSGEVRTVEVHSSPVTLAGRQFLFSIIHDITERKQAEALLLKSKENYDKLAARIPVGVYVLHTGQGMFAFEYVSPRMAEMLDVKVEELLASPEVIIKKIHPDDMKSFASNGEVIDGEAQPIEWKGRVAVKGEIKWLHIISSPESLGGGCINWHGLVTDITERVMAEEEIRQLNTDLEKRVDERTQELREAQEQLVRHGKLAVLGQMASSIGHELRNPLGVISSAVYYLNLVQPNADDKVKQYLGIIDQEVRTSEKIISDLLGFARIKSVDREAVSVSELIDQTLLRFPVPASVNVQIEIAGDLPRAYVDPRQMIQVLGNLTTNAWQAMTSTETKNSGQLSLCSNLQNDMINITVKDNGVGITPENMKKIFEPLFTTKAKGIGLGLAVSRKLVEANGGRIEVESEAGRGSSFHVLLPILKELE